MGKGSNVPPLSRRASKAAEGLIALAGSLPESEQAGDDLPSEQRGGQPAPFEAPDSLPRRVRGVGDRPRPPARVARPVLPESFLERVRAAAEAARREDEQASSDRPAGIVPATTGSAFVPPSREAPRTEAPRYPAPPFPAPPLETPTREAAAPQTSSPLPSTSLPRRVRGGNDSPRPPARVARPAMSASFLERVRAAIQADADADDHGQEARPILLPRRDRGEAGGPQPPAGQAQPVAGPETSSPGEPITEPIPVITAPVNTPAGAPAAAAAAASRESAAPAKPETAGAPAQPEAVTAPPRPKAVKAPPKPKAVKTPKSKAAKAPPKLPPTHRGPRADRGPRAPAEPGKSLKGQPRASRSYRMAGVLVTTVTVALLAAGFAVFHHSGGNAAGGNTARGSSTGRSGSGSARPADPATLSRDAAAWVAAQVGSASVISCDPVMCQALKARRIPAGRLYVLKPGMTNPLDSAVIVATPILRSQLGSRLASVYAPGLLASFGSGNRQIQVRSIALRGPIAYESQVKADLAARKMSGSALAENSRIVTSAAARKELAAGEVDSRLMTMIADLAASHPVRIVSFGESGPDTATAPFRSAELAETNMRNMLATLSGQQTPFRVAHMASVRLATGRPVLRIDFAAPSPFGLLGSGIGNGG